LYDAFVEADRLRTDTDHKTTELFVVIDDENSTLAEETQPSPEASDDKATRTLVTDFVTALTADAASVVVAGDAGSAQNGLVNVLVLGAGPVATVRALAAGEDGTHGHYGFADDAEEILPAKTSETQKGDAK